MSARAPDPGRLLRIVRTITGQTQADVAEKAGLDASVLSRYESGDRRISRSTAERLGRALFTDDE